MSSVRLVWITPQAEETISYLARVSNPKNQEKQANGELENPSGLLRHCVKHKHWSIFEMANICMEVNTERDIAAQILRHRSFSFQEFSQRYQDVSYLLEGGIPKPEMRLQHQFNKQLSTEINEGTNLKNQVDIDIEAVLENSLATYEHWLSQGIAKETIRRILPLCTPTRLYMNGTVRSWIHYLQVRDEEGVQKEHRIVAQQAKEVFKEQLPVVYEAVFGS